MFKNKLMIVSIVIVFVLCLLGVGGFVVWQEFIHPKPVAEEKEKEKKEEEKKTIEELVECCIVDSVKFTTNLKEPEYIIVAQFKFETTDDKGKEELELRMFQVENEILKVLASTSANELKESSGINVIEKKVTESINKLLTEGKVAKTLMIDKIVQ